MGNRSTNQQDLETIFCHLNTGEKLINIDDESILKKINTNINDNLKKIENFKIAENSK